MRLMHLPAMTGLIPAIAIHVCYLIAADAGHVPWCIPYIDNCTSISAVGRAWKATSFRVAFSVDGARG